MILSERQYVLLCELTGTGLLTSQHSGSVMGAVSGIHTSLTARGLAELAKAILTSSAFADWELLRLGNEQGTQWHIFMDAEQGRAVVTVSESLVSDASFSVLPFPLEEVARQIQGTVIPGMKTVFTGLGHGGWYAALLAEALGGSAIVFGAPTMEELPGNAVNYVGEDDPVGEYTAKVVFVKQTEDSSEEEGVPWRQKLVFDADGKAVVTAQSDFSRFVSWFYNTAGTIEPEVWNLFFPGSGEEEATILADLGVYSVFMKVGELNNEKILRSIDDTVRYVAGHLEAGRLQLTAELAKLPDDGDEVLFTETAEKHAMKASEFVMHIFESVQTVLMGVALFTLEQETIDRDTQIDRFRTQMFDLLEQELERVKDCLDQAIAWRLEKVFQIPKFGFEW